MCMAIDSWYLDVKASGIGYKVLSISREGPFSPVTGDLWKTGKKKVASLNSGRRLRGIHACWGDVTRYVEIVGRTDYSRLTPNMPVDPRFAAPQGIYMFVTPSLATTYLRDCSQSTEHPKKIFVLEWSGLLAKGFINAIPTFTVLEATLLQEYFPEVNLRKGASQ